jgi:hypothetical protein
LAPRPAKRRPATELAPALALVLALAACGGKQREDDLDLGTPNGENDPDRVAGEVLASLEQMTVAAERHVADCRAMADDLLAVFDRVRPVFDKVETLRRDPERERALTAALKRYDREAQAFADRMTAALEHCQLDPAVGDAMAKMPVIR